MPLKLLTYCLIIFISTTNCVEPYEFKPKEAGNFLVVDGGITQVDDINRIRLTTSTKYGTTTSASPIENASIKLVNSNKEFEYFINEGDGYYAHCGDSLKVEVGDSYYIEIDINENKYRSDPQTLPIPIDPDSITYKINYRSEINTIGNEVTFENIDIFINTPINIKGEITRLKWKVDESWSFTERKCSPLHNPATCYMSRKLNSDEFIIYSSEAITGNYLPDKLIGYKKILDRVEFIEKHYFNVHQFTLTEAAYDYWEKMVKIANPSGDIFDLPPAQLTGNVHNINDKDEIVLGYFEVVAKSTVRVALYRSDILPLTVKRKGYLCAVGKYVPACCACLVLDISSTDRPDYW